jgi:hypothetical protein
MMRLWWFAAISVALVLPAQTAAGTGTTPVSFEGRLATGGTVKFDLQQATGGGYEVLGWQWNNLRIKCRNGKHKYDGKFLKPAIPVIDYYFEEERLNRWGGTAKVKGLFIPAYQQADGIFRIRGHTAWGGRCRSGQVAWSATPAATPRV